MPDAIQFYMDQQFPGPASQGLRRHGVDVLTAQEAGRCGESDVDQLAFATAQDRVLVTFDTDFLALHQPEQKYSIGELIQALLLVHGVLDRASMRNHIEYL